MTARGTVRFKVDKTMLKEVEALASRGLDHQDIANTLGISTATLYDHKARNPEFADAIRRGKSKGKSHIQNAMYRRATHDGLNAVAQRAGEFLLERVHGMKPISETKNINLNTTPDAEEMESLSDAQLEAIIKGRLRGKP